MADEEQRPVERSIWSYVAPAALLAAITILVLIADSAGWFGRANEAPPPSSSPSPPAVTTPLPQGSVETTTQADTTAADTTAVTDTAASTDTTPATDATDTQTTGTTTITVTVAKGDTLNAIALRTNTTVARLLELNPGIDPQALTIGQEIVVG
jgi:LysM repeat protein